MHTLWVIRLAEERARLLAVHDGPVDRGDVGDAVAKEALELVHVVRAFATPVEMLAVYRVDTQPPWAKTQNEGILYTCGE